MSRSPVWSVGVAVCFAAFAWVGCGSLSDSSESISDSVSSPFESSSESSSRERNAEAAYLRDVEVLSYAFGAARGDGTSFLRELGRTASAHGISDWEAHPDTFAAIGAGWRRSGLGAVEAVRLARELFGADGAGVAGVLRAYPG